MKIDVEGEKSAKCGDKERYHPDNQCWNIIKCVKCGGNHLFYAWIYESWRKEKKILKIKYS